MSRVERWEKRAEVPLLLLATAFLVAYAWPVLDPRLSADLETVLAWASWAIWAAFAVDLIIRLCIADQWRQYAMRHWYDVALVAVPFLRPLRLLRLLALARILGRSASRNLAGRVGIYTVGIAVASVALGSLAVLDTEQSVDGSNIRSIGDALWWACATVSTVGYGDHYPITTQGRIMAVMLMIVGIGSLGAVTGAVTSWLVSQAREAEEVSPAN